MSCVIAIDLGSTVFKAALFDNSLQKIADAARDVPYVSGSFEKLSWRETMRGCCEMITELSRAGNGEVAAIAVTSQAQTFALRAHEHEPEYFISWRYEPSAEVLAEAGGVFGDDFADHCAFCEPVPGIALCTLREMFLKKEIPAGASLEFLPGGLVAFLTGRNCVDRNSAAMTGLFSRRSGEWHEQALSWCCGNGVHLPELVDPGSLCGITIPHGGMQLPANIPVILCGNDQSVGAYSADIATDEVFISLGTAYSIYARIPQAITVPGGASGEYLTTGAYALKTAPLGGDTLQKTVMERAQGDYRKFFAGEPDRDPAFNALLAGIADTVKAVNCNARHAVISGGGAKSPEMLEAIGRVLGIPVRRTEASPLAGAAAIAWNNLTKRRQKYE